VRRQAKSAPGRQRIATASNEPMAETSIVTVEQANDGSTEDNSQKDKKGTVANGPRGPREGGGQNKPVNKAMSRAQINVVKTMVYITVFFTLCWMPMYLYYLLSTFEVRATLTFLSDLFLCLLLHGRFKILVFPGCSALYPGHFQAVAANNRQREALYGPVVRPAVRPMFVVR